MRPALKEPKELLFLFLFTCLLFPACKTGSSDPFVTMNFDPYDKDMDKRVEAYYDAHPQDQTNTKNGKPSIYIDFSSGINAALLQPDIKSILTSCFSNVTANGSDSVCLYKLGNNKAELVQCTTKAPDESFYDPGNYGEKWSPIEKTVDEIVQKNSDALLITDFEEFQDKIEILQTPFLKPYFVKWLEKGNSIHFFIKDYNEGRVAKKIYFTVFSNDHSSGNNMLSKLKGPLEASTIGYHLSGKQYTLTTRYPTVKSGGIFYGEPENIADNKKYLDLKKTYVNGWEKGKAYEFYPLGVDWKTISSLKDAYKDQFNNFFRKLFIDLSLENAYIYGDFDVKVYDVSNDFIFFSKCKEVEKHQPKLAKDKNNAENKFADEETDAIALSCYNKNGSILDEWKYKPKESLPLPEVFVLNKALFANTKANDKKNTELAVAFHPGFNLTNISNPDGLMRVDIILNSATPNLSDAGLNKFKWLNAKGIENKALYESVIATLQEPSVKPNNKIIYSYFIKTLQ